MVAKKCSLPQTIKKWIVVVKLMEIKFSIFLNFFDVFSMFFFYVLSFYKMYFLYFCYSMFCRSMFRHRSKYMYEPGHNKNFAFSSRRENISKMQNPKPLA